MRAAFQGPRIAACIAIVCSMALSACGGSDQGGKSAASGSAKKTVKIGLVLIGPKNDRSFSQGVYEGALQVAKESGGRVEVTAVVENVFEPQAAVEAFRNLATAGNDVVYGGATFFAAAVEAVANDFPDTRFMAAAPPLEKFYPNVTTVVQQSGQPSFLAGVVMATLSKGRTVGWIGGGEGPTTDVSRVGLKAGVEYVDPKVKVRETITGDYNDAAKAKPAAEAQIATGADQVFSYLDAGVQGVYEATKGKADTGVYQIVNLDCSASPNVAGSAILNAKQFSIDTLKAFSEGSLKPGAIFYTLKSPGVLRLELCPDLLAKNPKLQDLVDKTTQKIVDGEIQLPSNAMFPAPAFDHVIR
jgi:basic membrane protein A